MPRYSDRVLKTALKAALAETLGVRPRLQKFERLPFASASSHWMEELRVEMAGGGRLHLLFKDVGSSGMLEAAATAKPASLLDPMREIEVYRRALADADLGTARFHGAVADSRSRRWWLFVEKVPGQELFQIGRFEIWRKVCAWLAGLHAAFQHSADRLAPELRLLRLDNPFFLERLRLAQCALLKKSPKLTRASQRTLEKLAEIYPRLIDEAGAASPQTLLHGEFYPSNILIQATAGRLRICPVDWEMAALGPALLDLAALTSGNWSEGQRRALESAYAAEAARLGLALPARIRRALDIFRLQTAIHWLGWSPDWTPPREHRYDWLEAALRLARKFLADK